MLCLPQVSWEGCQLSRLGIQELSPSDIEPNFETVPVAMTTTLPELTHVLGLVTAAGCILSTRGRSAGRGTCE